MPTIQVRNVPDDAYEAIRRQAAVRGQSIQMYMREQVIEIAERQRRENAWEEFERELTKTDPPGVSRDDILRAIDDARR
jgi:antitoxin FitA